VFCGCSYYQLIFWQRVLFSTGVFLFNIDSVRKADISESRAYCKIANIDDVVI